MSSGVCEKPVCEAVAIHYVGTGATCISFSHCRKSTQCNWMIYQHWRLTHNCHCLMMQYRLFLQEALTHPLSLFSPTWNALYNVAMNESLQHKHTDDVLHSSLFGCDVKVSVRLVPVWFWEMYVWWENMLELVFTDPRFHTSHSMWYCVLHDGEVWRGGGFKVLRPLTHFCFTCRFGLKILNVYNINGLPSLHYLHYSAVVS